MTEKKAQITPSQGGVFQDLLKRVKLVLRLLGDRRVNLLLKALPFVSVIYFFVPDPLFGPIDDGMLIWLTTYLFVELCPPQVVQEHMAELNRVVAGEWHDLEQKPKEGDIIDAEWRESQPK